VWTINAQNVVRIPTVRLLNSIVKRLSNRTHVLNASLIRIVLIVLSPTALTEPAQPALLIPFVPLNSIIQVDLI